MEKSGVGIDGNRAYRAGSEGGGGMGDDGVAIVEREEEELEDEAFWWVHVGSGVVGEGCPELGAEEPRCLSASDGRHHE